VATGTVGTAGDELNAINHTGLTDDPEDPFDWDSGSPKSLSGSISNPSTGDFGDFLVCQLAVDDTAAASGAITAETSTWQWDET
jgi:hypothetical protein